MNEENFEKWVTALESGQYDQTRDVLHDEGGWCCLGVGCDVAGIEFPEDAGLPPVAFYKWLGLPIPEGWENTYGSTLGLALDRYDADSMEELESNDVAELNDNGVDFHTIAALLRKHRATLMVLT